MHDKLEGLVNLVKDEEVELLKIAAKLVGILQTPLAPSCRQAHRHQSASQVEPHDHEGNPAELRGQIAQHQCSKKLSQFLFTLVIIVLSILSTYYFHNNFIYYNNCSPGTPLPTTDVYRSVRIGA